MELLQQEPRKVLIVLAALRVRTRANLTAMAIPVYVGKTVAEDKM